MSEDNKNRSFSESLVLGDSEKGVIITRITDDIIAAKSGLQAGDEIVAATIHLDHLDKNEVLNILKVLEPYDNNMKVLTKKELSASAGLGSFGLGLKNPGEMLTLNNDLSVDASPEAPVVSLDDQSGKLNSAQGLGVEISAPILNGDVPSLNEPSVDAGPKFTMPSLGLIGPGIKGDLNGNLKDPDVNVSTPQLNTPSASLDIEKPEIKTGNLKHKTPKFMMPQFNLPQLKTPKAEMDVSGDVDLPSVSGNLETPNLNLSVPELDLKSSDLNLNGPNAHLNGPDVNLEIPNTEVPSGKIKWPHLKWKGPKVKGPDANLNADLSAPDASLSTSMIEGDVRIPDIDNSFPKADIKGPDLDVQTPDLEMDTGKINWPHLRWKKPKLHSAKADLDLDANLNTPDIAIPKVEGGINAPDVDVNLPKVDLTGPDLDMQTRNIDVEAPPGKINWPHLKWKKPKGPRADLNIDADPNTPNLNLSTPNIEGDLNIPNAEVNLLKADIKGPDVDVQVPDNDIDALPGKINWPHLKWRKPKLHGPKAEMDFNGDLSTPDADLSVPIDGKISSPDIDLHLPKAEVDAEVPDGSIDAPSGKIRFPTLKKPKIRFSGPKVKSPDADFDADVKVPDLSLCPQASLDGPNVDLNLPKADVDVKAPNVDIEPPSGKFKWPTLKKPKLSLSGPKVNGPDVDLDADISAPDLNLSAAKIGGEINAPHLNLPKADLEGSKLDINAPDVEGASGKFKWFNIKKPKFGTLKGPKADIDADLNVPDVELKAPNMDLSTPDLNFSAPKIEGGIEASDLNFSMPNADLKGPDVDLNIPDLDLDTSDGKFNEHKFKIPKIPKVKGPELDADLKAPDLSLSASKIEGGFDAPDLDINLPKADPKGPNVDLQSPKVDVSAGKFKLSKMNLPEFGLSEPNEKGPNLNVDTDLKSSDLDFSATTITGELATPDLDLDADLKKDIDFPCSETNISLEDLNLSTSKIKGPDVDLNLPKANLEGASQDLTKADLQVPDLNLKAPNFSLFSPKMNENLSAPNKDILLPKDEVGSPQLKTPDLDFDSHLGDFKLPHFKLPKLDLSSAEVEVPSVHPSVEYGTEAPKANVGVPKADANISVPVVDLSQPQVEGDIKGSKIDVKAPNLDANLEKSKLPHFKLPKLNLSGSNIKARETDTSANLEVLPDVEVKAPSVKGKISSPHVSASVPEVKTSLNSPEMDITAEADAGVKSSPKNKLRWPFKWGLKSSSGTDEEGSGVDSDTDVSNTEVEVPAFKFHVLPRNSIDSTGETGDNLGLSKLDTEAKDYVVSKGVRLPIVNATSKAGEKVDIMERLKLAKEKAPSANISTTEAKTDTDLKLATPSLDVSAFTETADSSLVRGSTFKVEKQESVLGLVAPEISTLEENDKLSLSLSNMLGLNIKDSDAD